MTSGVQPRSRFRPRAGRAGAQPGKGRGRGGAGAGPGGGGGVSACLPRTGPRPELSLAGSGRGPLFPDLRLVAAVGFAPAGWAVRHNRCQPNRCQPQRSASVSTPADNGELRGLETSDAFAGPPSAHRNSVANAPRPSVFAWSFVLGKVAGEVTEPQFPLPEREGSFSFFKWPFFRFDKYFSLVVC